MITGWRSPAPPRPASPQEPQPEPHMWDGVTKEQLAKMNDAADKTASMVMAMAEGMPADQQSTMKNYQAMREASGRKAKVD